MKILICGSGPAAIQLGVLAKKFFSDSLIYMLTRPSERNVKLSTLHKLNTLEFDVITSRADLSDFTGSFVVQNIFLNVNDINEKFDLIILANPTFEYVSTIQNLIKVNAISKTSCIITSSSRLGISAEIMQILQAKIPYSSLVTFSDYLAVTVRNPEELSSAITSDEKSYLRYSISGLIIPKFREFITIFLKKFVSKLTLYESCWETEQANTNLFHLPIIIHPSLTERYFNNKQSSTFFYGPYPWGAYSMSIIQQIMQFEDELNLIYQSLNLPIINFFEFRMSRANLPLDAFEFETVNNYPFLSLEQRCFLHTMFLWMTERKRMGLEAVPKLIDTTGLPKFPRIIVNNNNQGCLPRIPLEDYNSLKAICYYANSINIKTLLFIKLCLSFENNCLHEPLKYGYKLDFDLKRFESLAEKSAQILRTKNLTKNAA